MSENPRKLLETRIARILWERCDVGTDVARAIACEILEVLGAEAALSEVEQLREQMREQMICNTCGGLPHASGKPCVCTIEGPKGTVFGEIAGLRRELFGITRERDAAREALVEARDEINKLSRAIREDANAKATWAFEIGIRLRRALTPEPPVEP
jgi:hypothetical protein